MDRAVRALVGCCLFAVVGLAGCDDVSTVDRPGQAVVVTGAELPRLVGKVPRRIVAFRHTRPDGVPTWTQIPVQVDERKVVPFGTFPTSNTTPGETGSVYGAGSGGPTALQYADPDTFVGADPNSAFDADDELVFMVADAGGRPRDGEATTPRGTVAGTGVAVQVDDPQREDATAWVHLFESAGGLSPSAGQDYVDYDFALSSGPYKTTYRRANGPNPETSSVRTDSYRIDFTDRWYEASWRIHAGSATGADILDGHKNQFAVDTCGRSNVTFASGEGAFVANIDGPVRAIRSYVGANSGPLTQRTHLMYQQVEIVHTDLRVHAIPGIMDFVDYSSAAVGMTYRSSTTTAGVSIDGSADSVATSVPTWEAAHGRQGTVITSVRYLSSVQGLTRSQFYRDQTTPPEAQCWGDGSFLGASGASITSAIPNTDPATTPAATLRGTRTIHFLPPPSDPAQVPRLARDLAADTDQPLDTTIAPYDP